MMLLLADLEIAARTVWGEGRGESWEGKIAIAFTLINRWREDRGQFARDDTLATACLRHVQFTAWNMGDPNFEKLHEVQWNDASLRECLKAVLHALDHPGDDPTAGARHYHAKSVKPSWIKGHRPSAEIGGHLFYNNIL